MTKPFNARELQTRVKNLIEQRTKLREYFAKELNKGITITKENQLPSMDQKFIQRAVEVVNEHLSENEYDVNQFSAEMALSRSQLHRKMKALTNKSATEFIRTIRLNKAAELLKQKTDNITQIAYETGFNNLSWFAKAFKEQVGVNPSEYIKKDH